MIKKKKETLYEVLNVSEDATSLEIKKAYRKKVRLYHPDKVASKNDPDLKKQAEKEMVKINIAKEVLLDPLKRSEYDLKLQTLRSQEILDAQESPEEAEEAL